MNIETDQKTAGCKKRTWRLTDLAASPLGGDKILFSYDKQTIQYGG